MASGSDPRRQRTRRSNEAPTSGSTNRRARRSYSPHLTWLLITVAMFVLGSHFGWREGGLRFLAGPAEHHAHRGSRSPDLEAGAVSPTDPNRQSTPMASGELDPGEVLDASSGNETTKEALSILTDADIEALARIATKSSDPVERRRAFARLLQEMQADTFTNEQALTMRSALHENRAGGDQWRAFDYAWGANDPESALAYLDQIPDRYRDGFTGNMLPGLASVEPQMAIDLVSSMEGRQQFRMTERLIEGLADYDIGFATDYVNTLAANDTRGASHHMRRLTGEVLGTVGFDRGKTWAEELAPGTLQATALRQVAHNYANQDPLEAARWAEQFVGQEQNSRLFGEVVREWGDFHEASQWVESLEPSLAQRDALSAVYGFRGSSEPHEAVQDIINMPVSENRDFAINGFISGLAHQDAEAAAIWAGEIHSPGLREAAMIRAGKQFFAQNQQAATEWFQSSGLPESALGKMTRTR